eukprot:1152509-Pelagomonas_calceolata.AAC.1
MAALHHTRRIQPCFILCLGMNRTSGFIPHRTHAGTISFLAHVAPETLRKCGFVRSSQTHYSAANWKLRQAVRTLHMWALPVLRSQVIVCTQLKFTESKNPESVNTHRKVACARHLTLRMWALPVLRSKAILHM